MRFLWLYLRSRRVPLALALAAGATASVWGLWLAQSDSRTINVKLAAATLMLVVASFGATLSGADDALDHTAARSWRVLRAGHVMLSGGVIAGLMLLTATTDARFEPAAVVLRNTAGMLGLTAIFAALAGAAYSWIAPLAWTLVTLLPQVVPSQERGMQIAGWLIQPAGTTTATTCAAVLAATGLLAYTLRGCPRRPLAETAPDE
jgi:hypothetical protein